MIMKYDVDLFHMNLSYQERKFFYISQKKSPSLLLSFRAFKKILPNTFIYESILINIYMNADIMNTQIFYFN